MDMDDPRHLPVFVQPSEINFVLGRPETHKCMLTIFNPYPFAVQFRVLCNAPSKYAVGITRGNIRQGCYIDTTIRHKNPAGEERGDRLRIELYRLEEDSPCGLKEIPLNVLSHSSAASRRNSQQQQRLIEFSDEGSGASSSAVAAAGGSGFFIASRSSHHHRAIPGLARSREGAAATATVHQELPNTPNFYWLAILSFLFCVSVLLLPQYVEDSNNSNNGSNDNNNQKQHHHQQQQQQWIPNWVRPTVTSKCVSAYVLGILTVYFFLQPTA